MIDIDSLKNNPAREEWDQLYKELITVNLFKVLCVGCSKPVKFKTYKIFAINKKHGSDKYYYIIIADEDGKPKITNNKYAAVRISGSFPVLDENQKVIGTVEEKLKLIEENPFYISAIVNKNNALRWAVVVVQNAKTDE